LKAPIVGLVARSGTAAYPPEWFKKRLQDQKLGESLKRVRLYDEFSLLGTYLAGAVELRAFAGPGPLNTDNHPLVAFRAPGFVYGTPESAELRLLQLVRSFHPQPAELLTPPPDAAQRDRHRRLAEYWTARNRFIETGLGVKETGDLRCLLAQVREPLLDIVRLSRDFEAAYNPLLALAQGLCRIDPPAGDRLLRELEKANPYREEAHRMRQRLSFFFPGGEGKESKGRNATGAPSARRGDHLPVTDDAGAGKDRRPAAGSFASGL
jgi:spermidine synthase